MRGYIFLTIEFSSCWSAKRRYTPQSVMRITFLIPIILTHARPHMRAIHAHARALCHMHTQACTEERGGRRKICVEGSETREGAGRGEEGKELQLEYHASITPKARIGGFSEVYRR